MFENEDELAKQVSEKMHAGQYQSMKSTDVGAAMCGSIGGSATQPLGGRPGLRERTAKQLQQANRERRKVERLEELSLLLAKHPDVARILDLLEETSG